MDLVTKDTCPKDHSNHLSLESDVWEGQCLSESCTYKKQLDKESEITKGNKEGKKTKYSVLKDA